MKKINLNTEELKRIRAYRLYKKSVIMFPNLHSRLYNISFHIWGADENGNDEQKAAYKWLCYINESKKVAVNPDWHDEHYMEEEGWHMFAVVC